MHPGHQGPPQTGQPALGGGGGEVGAPGWDSTGPEAGGQLCARGLTRERVVLSAGIPSWRLDDSREILERIA